MNGIRASNIAGISLSGRAAIFIASDVEQDLAGAESLNGLAQMRRPETNGVHRTAQRSAALCRHAIEQNLGRIDAA